MANVTTNLLNITLTPVEAADIGNAISTIDSNLANVEQGLTDEQRRSLFAFNESNKVFAEEALQEMTTNGAMLPSAVNATFLTNDLNLFNQLDGIESQLEGLLRKVKDTKRVAAHEAYTMALTVYTLYKSLAAVGIPGAQQSADRLGERFEQQSTGASQSANTPEDPDPEA